MLFELQSKNLSGLSLDIGDYSRCATDILRSSSTGFKLFIADFYCLDKGKRQL